MTNSMTIQIGRRAGPAPAGSAIGSPGAALAFWTKGATFPAVIASLLPVRAT